MSKQPDLKATILDEFREKFPTLQVETIEELLPAIETIQKYPEQIEAFLSTAIDRVREEEQENIPVGFLRQLINEERTKDGQKLVTNEDLMSFIEIGYKGRITNLKQKILITCDWKMKDQSFEIVFDGEYYFGDSEVSVLDSLIKATDLERQDVIITRDYDLKKLKEITKDHNSDAVYNYQMFTVPEEFIDDLTNLKQERDE